MVRIKLTIQYDGTNYLGWQRQKKGQTIQAKVEDALFKIFKREVKIRGAGRTDAGVHAIGQVATFNMDINFPIDKLKKAMNALLPSDIRIIDIEEAEESFHPQYSVKKKSYLYYVCYNEYCNPFLQRYVWHYERRLNLYLMEEAKELFLGTKDFTPFSGSTEVKDKIRTVYDLTIELSDKLYFLDMTMKGSFVKFRIEADGFLKYMVRNIVGCLVEVARGGLTKGAIVEAMKTGRRPNPLRTAPPHGLFLEKIIY